MPATTLCTPKDVEYRVNRAEATVVITDLENAPKIVEVVANCPSLKHLLLIGGARQGWISCETAMQEASPYLDNPGHTRSDDPLLIYFTSGTVGFPKMVLHTQASYALAHLVTAKFWHDLKPTAHWPKSFP